MDVSCSLFWKEGWEAEACGSAPTLFTQIYDSDQRQVLNELIAVNTAMTTPHAGRRELFWEYFMIAGGAIGGIFDHLGCCPEYGACMGAGYWIDEADECSEALSVSSCNRSAQGQCDASCCETSPTTICRMFNDLLTVVQCQIWISGMSGAESQVGGSGNAKKHGISLDQIAPWCESLAATFGQCILEEILPCREDQIHWVEYIFNHCENRDGSCSIYELLNGHPDNSENNSENSVASASENAKLKSANRALTALLSRMQN